LRDQSFVSTQEFLHESFSLNGIGWFEADDLGGLSKTPQMARKGKDFAINYFASFEHPVANREPVVKNTHPR
jgi:hypothetical protein